MSNAILPEAGASHVEELADPYLLWFWNSNVRSTAIVLNSLAKEYGFDLTTPWEELAPDLAADRRIDAGTQMIGSPHAGNRSRSRCSSSASRVLLNSEP